MYESNRANTVRALRLREESRECWRSIKSTIDEDRTGSIATLEIVTDASTGSYRVCEDKNEIEDTLIRANKKKFSLTEGTPFRVEPLATLCGDYGTNVPYALL